MSSFITKKNKSGTSKNKEIHEGLQQLTLVAAEDAPIVSSYNDRIRPLLDVIDKLRRLNIMKEGIHLPTIVVVGDQSSGKSSVLESLAGISLPRGQGICTRVPLIMRLQHLEGTKTEMYLEYMNKTVQTDEGGISDAIESATDEIAGSGKGISNTPLTLVVKKNGVPDLTMVDLPGITRVPVHGQPEDIYEQISGIIKEYIEPEESIILNVLSATVDFTTCESIRMSQKVDKTGERTLAVVTKADRAPEGLLEKVIADDVNIGLGYVCVRNRIGEESYEDARMEEKILFQSHPLLSKIEKSMVSVPVLAQRLVQIQATIITRRLPDIVKKINEKLNSNMSELKKMPQNLSSVAEAITAFMRVIGLVKESLRKILLRGEFEEYPDDKKMHCTARLAEMLNQYADELESECTSKDSTKNFLMEEIIVLEETKGIGLPNFLPRTAFLVVLQRKVKDITSRPLDFVVKLWNYIEGVVVSVLMHHCDNYPQLLSSTRRAVRNLFYEMKDRSVSRVSEIMEMEKLTDYTCNPDYISECTKMMALEGTFIDKVRNYDSDQSMIMVPGFGEIDVGYLRPHQHVLQQALDLKMRMTSYWKIVLRRLVDSMALHLLHSLQYLVNDKLEFEIVNELMAGPSGGVSGIEKMLEESPAVASKRNKLNKSIRTLEESKEVVANIMDRLASHDDYLVS